MNQTLVVELSGGTVTVSGAEFVIGHTMVPRYAVIVGGQPGNMLVAGVSRYLADAAAEQFNKLAKQNRRECRATVTRL